MMAKTLDTTCAFVRFQLAKVYALFGGYVLSELKDIDRVEVFDPLGYANATK